MTSEASEASEAITSEASEASKLGTTQIELSQACSGLSPSFASEAVTSCFATILVSEASTSLAEQPKGKRNCFASEAKLLFLLCEAVPNYFLRSQRCYFFVKGLLR
jgi:hypothetical protein